MFTGIVEAIGTILTHDHHPPTESATPSGSTLTITDAATVLPDCHLGDSIAVNGVCLTVTAFTDSQFTVGLAPETLRRTNLGSLKSGDVVNLERAVGDGVRFGGHFVQGHVDTVATIVSKERDGDAIKFRFKLRDLEYKEYIVEKGYVTVDGASLTVTVVDGEGEFGIMMVEYTQSKVVTARKEVGDEVNVEVDVLGKYVENQVKAKVDALSKKFEEEVDRRVEERVKGLEARIKALEETCKKC
ncbi:riboflavin synthase [Ascobolus immersus RN42]|uniref:Riboflavin synthase n=1 Tax=Ascobolus immersus RN42 TaxID=1160509 RepID=A0A3N4IGF6_ASCIM|nr:riboflavin synthase [Ascobolus immersus RN42]